MSAPSSEVVQRLELLADRAPTGVVDPDAVWSRGRRRQRQRLGVVAAFVGVIAVVGAVTAAPVARLVDPPVATVPAPSGLVLPDVIREPGGWEPSFTDVPGRLSAVGVGNRAGLWSSRRAVWGVSGTTGESRYLDLPGAVPSFGSSVALSADGRRLAYPVTGSVDGEPLSMSGADHVEPIVGVAVLDLETGARQVWEIASEHGLSIDGVAWAGEVLWWSGGPVRPEGPTAMSVKTSLRSWNASTGERDEQPGAQERGVYPAETGDAPDGFVNAWGAGRLLHVTGGGERTVLRLRMPEGTSEQAGITQPAMSTDGSRLAALLLPDASAYDDAPKAVLVGEVTDRGVDLRRLDTVEEQGIAGWRSPTGLVVVALDDTEDGHLQGASRAWTVDVTTAARTELLTFSGSTPQVAADAWAGEVVAAPRAPFAPDPRLAAAFSAVVLAFGISLWRDLRRRRGHP